VRPTSLSQLRIITGWESDIDMNDFDWGKTFGRFFISWIINDDFCGLEIRVGKEYADDAFCGVFHLTIQIGYGQLTVGIAEKKL